MADIEHEIKIDAPPDRVFHAVTTAGGLKSWKTPDVSGTGAIGDDWLFEFPGRPRFSWRVVDSLPARRVEWRCIEGPGESAGTSVAFELAPEGDGGTFLTCRHAGWPGPHGNFRKCNTTWGILLHHLRQFVETDTAAPAFA